MIAISATVDNLLGWFSVMATYMNITEKFAQWGRRYTYTRLQAAKDNVIEFPEVRVSHVSTKTEIGQGKLPSHYDSKSIEEMSVTELEKTCTEQFAITKEDSNAEDHKKNLLNDQDTIKLDPNRLFAEIRTYVENRGKRAIINIQNENKPALVFAPRRVDADTFFENWNKTNTQNECVVWHGESDDFISSKGDSDAIQKRLQDLNDPLQVIVLVGMWKSGVDIDISRIHDLAYKHKNKDRKIQVVGRMRKGGVYHAYTDVLNIFEKYDSKLVDDLCKQMGITPEEVQVLLTAKDVNQDDDDPNDQIQAGKKTEENGDEDNENTRHLEKLFGLGEEPITVGWIKRVGNAESSDVITIPNDVFHSGGDNLSDRKKIDNFMREIESA